jgi:methionyl-tRNA formyltransferase
VINKNLCALCVSVVKKGFCMMDLVFCGTPQFAVPTLEKLVCAGFRVKLVATQPDRPSGRGMELAASPVKQIALALGLPVTQPEKIRNNPEFRAQLESIAPEAIIVVGYGRIIPQWMIDLPRLGNINLHASLLPRYRGAAPIQWAIARGETITGVTTMRIDAGLDTGDTLLQAEERITPEDTSLTLAPRLAQTGAELMIRTLAGLRNGTITPRRQDDARATLAPILKREDGQIDFSRPAVETWNRLRGFQPWPGAFTYFRGKTLHLHAAITLTAHSSAAPGHFAIEGDRLLLGFALGTALEIKELQPEGKKRMSARDFINGYRPKSDEVVGSG